MTQKSIHPKFYVDISTCQPHHQVMVELREKETHQRRDYVLIWKHPFLLRLRLMLAIKKLLKSQTTIDSLEEFKE